MRKNLGFTLVEVLVAVSLTGMILLTGYSAFQSIMQAQASLGAAIDVQKNLFYTNEKLAALIRGGGTIDYEEYFNRRMLGYAQEMRPDGIYTFSEYSRFGNGVSTGGKQTLYYCGVSAPTGEECMAPANPPHKLFDSSLYPGGPLTLTHSFPSTPPEHQPYGQYAALSYDYLNPGFPMPIKLPPIFEAGGEPIKVFDRSVNQLVDEDPLDVGLPELYLIKQELDNTYTRTYFRHVYVQDTFTGSPTCVPTTSLDGCLGKIQITKLEGCEVSTADGIIDAWIPREEFWIGTGAWSCATIVPSATDIYKAAHEDTITGSPDIEPNLTWVDVTPPDMNVVRAVFLPKPLKIPALMSGTGDAAQSPSVSVYLEVALSTKLRSKSFIRPEMNYPRILITTYDLSQ